MSDTTQTPSPSGDGFVDVAGLALRVLALEREVALLSKPAQGAKAGVDPAAVIKAVEQLEAQNGS